MHAVFILFISLFFLVHEGTAQASTLCRSFFKEHAGASLLSAVQLIPQLPDRRSKTYKAWVGHFREQLLQTRSFAIIDLSPFLTDQLVEAWKNSFPTDRASHLEKGKLWTKNPVTGLFEPLARPAEMLRASAEIKKWLRQFLKDAFQHNPDVQIGPGSHEMRSSMGAQRSLTAGNWHLDGGGISASLSLYGPGTEVLGAVPDGLLGVNPASVDWPKACPECRPVVVGPKQLFIFFGLEADGQNQSVKPAIHRTPFYEDDRLLFLFRF